MYLKKVFFISLSILLAVGCRSKADRGNSSEKERVKNEKLANVLVLKPSEDTSEYNTIQAIDLGTIHAGEIVSGKLNFTTTSDTTINIRELKGTCGCTDIDGVFKELKRDEVKSVSYLIRTVDKSGEEYFDIIIDSSIGKYIVEIKANVKIN